MDSQEIIATESNSARSAEGAATALSVVPQHVAIIMDGNGRWAKSRSLGRLAGHRAGAKSVRTVVEESRKLGIRYLTLYAFSTENWSRPEEEVRGLMSLLIDNLKSELTTLTKNDIRLRAIGDLSRLPSQVASALQEVTQKTEHHRSMDLILALSYGARDEITSAVKRIAERVSSGALKPEEINAETVRKYLYAPDVPDPDVLIRTSSEYRVSNFLLWQIAYSELVVTKVSWPEFGAAEFRRCLQEFGTRTRRFGLTDEQLRSS